MLNFGRDGFGFEFLGGVIGGRLGSGIGVVFVVVIGIQV